MVRSALIGSVIQSWAEQEPTVRALVQIGSRVRAQPEITPACDDFSDWDFQVVTSKPEMFANHAWLDGLGLGRPIAYVARTGRLGTATKVAIALRGGEIDLVVLPVARLRPAKWLLRLGLATRLPGLRHALSGLAMVLRDGHKIIKGEAEWGVFLGRVIEEFPPPRLDDAAVRSLAEGFVCDFISTRHKVERGELLAAQRWLHHQLAEVNFQLLHELRQRRGEGSFPDARRIERVFPDWRIVEVDAAPRSESLRTATGKSADTLRGLMRELVPDWRWPL